MLEGTGSEPFDVTRVVDGTGVDATGAARGEGLGISTATPLGGVATGAGGTADPVGADAGSGGSGGVNPVAVAVGVGVLVALAYGGTQLRKAHRPDAGLAAPAGRHVAPAAPRPGHGAGLAGAGTAGPGIAVRPEAQLVGVGAGDAHPPSGTALRAPSAVWATGPGSSGPDGPAGPRRSADLRRRPRRRARPGRSPGRPRWRPGRRRLRLGDQRGPRGRSPGSGGRAARAGSATPASAWPFAGDPGAGPYRDDRSSGRPRR